MEVSYTHPRGLSGNQLKILALLCMTADHVGLQLLPQILWLRLIGRLAFPIYGWMIAEGCRHTHDRKRYLLRLAALAAVCQVVYFVAMGSVYQCVLVTFSLSAVLIFALNRAVDCPGVGNRLTAAAVLAGVLFVTECLPDLLPRWDYAVDYGIWGVLLPVGVYLGRNRGEKLALLSLTLIGLGATYGGIQWFALAAVPVLALYNGTRGKRRIGRLFYWYYPGHLAAIYGLSLIFHL